MGWVKGSDRNFKASQTERYRKTKKDRRERRDTSGGGPKIRVSDDDVASQLGVFQTGKSRKRVWHRQRKKMQVRGSWMRPNRWRRYANHAQAVRVRGEVNECVLFRTNAC